MLISLEETIGKLLAKADLRFSWVTRSERRAKTCRAIGGHEGIVKLVSAREVLHACFFFWLPSKRSNKRISRGSKLRALRYDSSGRINQRRGGRQGLTEGLDHFRGVHLRDARVVIEHAGGVQHVALQGESSLMMTKWTGSTSSPR